MRWLLLLWFWPILVWGQVSAIDDEDTEIQLDAPAQRIVSLSPHATELLFSLGAGQQVVGIDSASDYPPQVARLPRIGNAHKINLEILLNLKPDLVVGWRDGNGQRNLQRLRELGLKVFVSQPDNIAAVNRNLIALGRLSGHGDQARQITQSLRKKRDQLASAHQHEPKVRVFYQIWGNPIMTLNGQHPVNEIIELCGGRNLFADLPGRAPSLNLEAVVAADPQVIIGSGMGSERPVWLDAWQRWPGISATRSGHLYQIHPDLLQRNGPRILDGAERLCRLLEQVRQ